MMVCMNCYQKNSIILYGNHDVESEMDGEKYILNIYSCKICKTIHEVYTPITQQEKESL